MYANIHVGLEKWVHCAGGVRGVIENERRLMRAVREPSTGKLLHYTMRQKSTLLDASNTSTSPLVKFLSTWCVYLVHHDT